MIETICYFTPYLNPVECPYRNTNKGETMTAATITKINAAITKHGVEVVKGSGYFWFSATHDDAPQIPSVYSMTLRCMTLEQWVQHVETYTRS